MLKGVILAITSFEDVLVAWEEIGFFEYVLPFLLIFALIFGVLARIKIFGENKAINAIIALAVGLMSLQVTRVSEFFSEIFPRLGMGLAVMLVVLIFMGFFMGGKDDDKRNKAINYMLLGIGFIIFLVILIQTSAGLGWSAQWWQANWAVIAVAIFILLLIVIIVVASGGKREGQEGFFVAPRRER